MLTKICDFYARILRVLLRILGMSLLVSVAIQVAARYIPLVPRYLWPMEVTNFSLIWMIFVGAVLGVREKRHFFVDIFLTSKVPPILERGFQVVYYVVMTVVTLIFIIDGYDYLMDWGLIQTSDITGINLGWLYASVPLAGWSWLLFLIESLVNDLKGKSVKAEGASTV